MRVWDPATGEQLQQLTGHTDWVRGVAWAPDATRLASASDDGSVRVWDPATGEQLQQLTGYTGWVNGVAWAPDATRLASAGRDGSVRVWDPATGELLLTITTFDDGEHATLLGGELVACSPGAWRWLGWLAPSPITGQLTRYPAEVFGPLPTQSASAQPAAG